MNAVKSQAQEGDKALIFADLMQTAVTILQRGEALYPFHGLQGFPDNYPMLVTGDAQSNCVRGSACTVLANATELFTNIDSSMPKFSDWLQQSMGINSTATLEVRARCAALHWLGAWMARCSAMVLRLNGRTDAAAPALPPSCTHTRRLTCLPLPCPVPAGVQPHLAAHALQHHQRLRRPRGVHHALRLHLLPADHVHPAVLHRHVPGGRAL